MEKKTRKIKQIKGKTDHNKYPLIAKLTLKSVKNHHFYLLVVLKNKIDNINRITKRLPILPMASFFCLKPSPIFFLCRPWSPKTKFYWICWFRGGEPNMKTHQFPSIFINFLIETLPKNLHIAISLPLLLSLLPTEKKNDPALYPQNKWKQHRLSTSWGGSLPLTGSPPPQCHTSV